MTTSHEPFDDTAKVFYRQFFEKRGLAVEIEPQIFFRARSIDLIVTCNDSDRIKLQDTVFSHFIWLNALELKGINDRLTVRDYNRIMMRAWGLGALKKGSASEQEDDTWLDEDDEDKGGLDEDEQDDTDVDTDVDYNKMDDSERNQYPSQRTLTVVCLRKPQKILNRLQADFSFVQKEPGIYHNEGQILQQWIICPSELALVEKNYPLLPLARGKKLAQFISLCLQKGMMDYLHLIIDIGLTTDPNVILQKIMEIRQMKLKLHQETQHQLDDFFRKMPEQMLKIPFFQEAQKLSEQRGEQRILIRLLHRKFSVVPESVVQKIEATDDLEQLDNWADQILTANSLADMGLITDKATQ